MPSRMSMFRYVAESQSKVSIPEVCSMIAGEMRYYCTVVSLVRSFPRRNPHAFRRKALDLYQKASEYDDA